MTPDRAAELVESLFGSWGPSLLCHAMRVSGDSGTADDLVQEAFLSLYVELRRGRRIGNPRAWTLAVVRNHARTRARNIRRRGEVLACPGLLDNLYAPAAEEEERSSEIAVIMSVLSSREKDALLLRMDSLKYREIAQHLGVTAKTVATLLSRALRKLHRAAGARTAGESLPVPRVDDVRKALQ